MEYVGPRDFVLDWQSVSRDTDQWRTDLTNVIEEVNTLTRSVVLFCPNVRFCCARVDMLGLRAWSNDLNVILIELFDDDTKLAQSCMGIGKDCDKHRQDTPPRSICWFVSGVASINLDETAGMRLLWRGLHMALFWSVLSNRTCFSVLFRHQTRSDCRHGLGVPSPGRDGGHCDVCPFVF